MQTIQAKNITLRDLITSFGIQLVRDEQFFREWQDDLPEITDLEKQPLDQVVDGFINLLNYSPLQRHLHASCRFESRGQRSAASFSVALLSRSNIPPVASDKPDNQAS